MRSVARQGLVGNATISNNASVIVPTSALSPSVGRSMRVKTPAMTKVHGHSWVDRCIAGPVRRVCTTTTSIGTVGQAAASCAALASVPARACRCRTP